MTTTASWLDAPSGRRELAAFERWPGGRCFSVVHRPAGPARATVVVCSPVLIEQMRNYRREVELARLLADHGLATLRFHYRGTGHSDGSSEDLALETMIEDTGAAVAHARTLGQGPIVLIGTRVGAMVAASVAPTAPLVLWHPVLRGRAWAREVHRARAVGELRHGPASENEDVGEDPEVLGFRLTPRLVESLDGVDIRARLAERSGPVLVVQAGRRGGEMWQPSPAGGAGVARVTVPEDTSGWWFPAALSQARGSDEELLRVTVDWIVTTVGVR